MPIKCAICGKELHTITPNHLKSHWIKIQSYRILFPNAPLRSEETKQTISRGLKGKPKSEEHRAKLSKLNKARASDPRWIEKMTKAQQKRRKREAQLSSPTTSTNPPSATSASV